MPRHAILIVEDQRVLGSALRMAFERDGYLVLIGEDSETALQIAEENHIDVLISDLRLPGIGGIELVGKIRALQPHVKSVIMTAYRSQEQEVAAMGVGISHFVDKPFRLEQMRAVVEKLLEGGQGPAHTEPTAPGSGTPEEGSIPRLQFRPEASLGAVASGYTFLRSPIAPPHQHFFDIIPASLGRVGIVFGETSVGGSDGLTLISLVQALICAEMHKTTSPDELVKKLNQTLCRDLNQRTPMKLFCALCEQKQHRVRYVNCGGLPGAIISADPPGDPERFVPLKKTGMQIGVFPNAMTTTVETQLKPQDAFVLGGHIAMERIFERQESSERFLTAFLSIADRTEALTAGDVAPLVADAARGDPSDPFALVHFHPHDLAVEQREAAVRVSRAERGFEETMTVVKRMALMAGLSELEQQQAVSAALEAVICALDCPEPKTHAPSVCVHLLAKPGELIVEVANERWTGEAMKPVSHLSAKIMHSFMDSVAFELADAQGAIVHMAKRGTQHENRR